MMNLQTTLHQIEFFWKDVHYQITMIDRMQIDINEQPQFPSLTQSFKFWTIFLKTD